MIVGVPVRQILAHPELTGARVVGGARNLDRLVRAVTVAEIPDIAQWLNGDDFVHGVGKMFVSSDGEVDETAFLHWVEDLIVAGAACFAIKPGRYLGSIPQSVLQLGDMKGFPIIELPAGVVQSRVSQIIYEMVLAANRTREEQRVQLFIQMVMDLSGPHVLNKDAAVMASYVNHPVVIADQDFHVIGTSFADCDGVKTSIADIGIQMQHAIAAGRILPEHVTQSKQMIVESVSASSTEESMIVSEISYRGQVLGYAAMLARGGSITPNQIYFFGTLCEVLTVDMSHSEMMETSALTMASEFFTAISDAQLNSSRIRHIADILGINYLDSLTVVMIAFTGSDTGNFDAQPNAENSSRAAIRYATEYLNSTLQAGTYVFGNWVRGVAFVLQGNFSAAQIRRVTENLVRGLEKTLHRASLLAGIGATETGIAGVWESAHNALSAITCMEMFQLNQKVARYDELGLFLFLNETISNTKAAHKYVDFILGELLQQDVNYGGELLDTLKAYIAADGSYSGAGKQLCVHVNTVRYRMTKIAELLPVDISATDGKCAVWLAILISSCVDRDAERKR